MKSVRKNDQGVSPVIAVILMVAITVVLAGVLYLWVSSLADTEETVENLNLRSSIYEDTAAAADKLVFEIIGGTVDWDNYKVTIDGTEVAVTGTSSAGDTISFTGNWTIAKGTAYHVKIINIGENKMVWENKELIAKSYASA